MIPDKEELDSFKMQAKKRLHCCALCTGSCAWRPFSRQLSISNFPWFESMPQRTTCSQAYWVWYILKAQYYLLCVAFSVLWLLSFCNKRKTWMDEVQYQINQTTISIEKSMSYLNDAKVFSSERFWIWRLKSNKLTINILSLATFSSFSVVYLLKQILYSL